MTVAVTQVKAFAERLATAFERKREPRGFTKLLDEMIVILEPITAKKFAKDADDESYAGPRSIGDCVEMTYKGLWIAHKDARTKARDYILTLARIADGKAVAHV